MLCTKQRRNRKYKFLNLKIIDCKLKKESLIKISGKLYPPKNKIAVIQLNNTIEEYSPKKKKTKGTDECSVKNPATNSDSIQNGKFVY